MVKAEIIENPEVSKETGIIATDNVPNVDVAIEQWDAYQKLCKGLLNDNDYQEIIVKEKDENGNYVPREREEVQPKTAAEPAAAPIPDNAQSHAESEEARVDKILNTGSFEPVIPKSTLNDLQFGKNN